MNSNLGSLGSFLGVAIVVVVAGWLAVHHYIDTRDERLPLKIQQELMVFQKKLPIEVQPGLLLEDYELTQTSISLGFKIIDRDFLSQDRTILREQLEVGYLIWTCDWREKYIGTYSTTVKIRIVAPDDSEITTLVISKEDCENPVPQSSNKIAL